MNFFDRIISKTELADVFMEYTADAVTFYLQASDGLTEHAKDFLDDLEDHHRRLGWLSKKQVFWTWRTLSNMNPMWLRPQDRLIAGFIKCFPPFTIERSEQRSDLLDTQ